MKRRIVSLLTAVSVLCPILGAIAPVVSAESDQIYGWTYNNGGNGASCSLNSTYYSEGTHSAMLKVESGASQTLQTNINAEKGKAYAVSFWAKAINCGSLSFSIGNTALSLTSQMSSYNWTKFEVIYTHSQESGSVAVKFELKTKGEAYIDGVRVCLDEKGLQQNLVKNPGFEITEVLGAGDVIRENSQTSADTVLASYSDKSTLPLFPGRDINIDADLGEWSGLAPISLPYEGQSVSTISGYSGAEDMSAVFYAAQDEEYLYLSAAVTDDVHYQQGEDESHFWRGDSVQLVLATAEEDYGVEMGFYLTGDTNESKVYSSALIQDAWGTVDPTVIALREKTKFCARRDGNITYYEIAVPWTIKFDKRPEELLIDFLINDNDGSGRGYLEWKDGIAVTKSNEKFATMIPTQVDDGVFGYIDGTKSIQENSVQKFLLYIYNLSDTDKDLNVNYEGAALGEVKLNANSVYLMPLEVKAAEQTEKTVTAEISYDGTSTTAVKTVPVKRDLNKAFEDFRQNQLAELKDLAEKCRQKDIKTDYEDIDLVTIESFIDYGLEDLNGGRESRAEYVFACLEKLYNEAKTELEAYLGGTKEPKEAIYFAGGDKEIVNQAVYGDTINSKTGEVRRAPVFLSGYLDNTRASDEIAEVGANMLQFEVMMSGYIKSADSVPGWNIGRYGGVDASYSFDSDNVKSGDYSLKISNASAAASNVYTTLVQNVALEGGKTYVLSFNAKADSANGCSYRPNGWKTSKISISGSYDWKRYTYEYNPEEDCTVELMFMCEGITNGLYLDNIKITEKGETENLVRQGTFEQLPTIINGFSVDTARFEREVITALDEAAKNNVAVDVLLAVHYFPQNLLDEVDWKSNQSGFIKYNIYNENVKKMTEAFFKGLVPLMANHKALNSICISNEPTYRAGRDESNAPAWHEYLRELYNDDVALMNDTWHERFESFDAVPMQEQYENPAIYYDYLRFNDKLFADWHSWLAGMVKQIAPNVPVHAKVMSVIDQTEATGSSFALVRGTDPELIAECSDLNGNDAWNFIGSSRTLTVKNLWYDYLTSIKNVPVFNSEDHVIVDRDEVYNEKYAPHVAADLWQGAIHGRTMMTMWKWERTLSTTSSASGNIKHRPDVVAKEGKTMLDLNRLATEIEALQNVKPTVALLYSYPSRVHSKLHMNSVYSLYQAIGNNGHRTKIVTEKMIAENALDQIKLLIVPNAVSTTAQALDGIKRFIESGGKVMLVGDCFLYDEHKNPFADASTLEYIKSMSQAVNATTDEIGVKLITEENINQTLKGALSLIGADSIELIDAQTGLPVSDFEWCYTEYNGNTLINLCMYSWNGDKNISIRRNGQTVSGMTELRSEAMLDEIFTVSGYEPMLIEIANGEF